MFDQVFDQIVDQVFDQDRDKDSQDQDLDSMDQDPVFLFASVDMPICKCLTLGNYMKIQEFLRFWMLFHKGSGFTV